MLEERTLLSPGEEDRRKSGSRSSSSLRKGASKIDRSSLRKLGGREHARLAKVMGGGGGEERTSKISRSWRGEKEEK